MQIESSDAITTITRVQVSIRTRWQSSHSFGEQRSLIVLFRSESLETPLFTSKRVKCVLKVRLQSHQLVQIFPNHHSSMMWTVLILFSFENERKKLTKQTSLKASFWSSSSLLIVFTVATNCFGITGRVGWRMSECWRLRLTERGWSIDLKKIGLWPKTMTFGTILFEHSLFKRTIIAWLHILINCWTCLQRSQCRGEISTSGMLTFKFWLRKLGSRAIRNSTALALLLGSIRSITFAAKRIKAATNLAEHCTYLQLDASMNWNSSSEIPCSTLRSFSSPLLASHRITSIRHRSACEAVHQPAVHFALECSHASRSSLLRQFLPSLRNFIKQEWSLTFSGSIFFIRFKQRNINRNFSRETTQAQRWNLSRKPTSSIIHFKTEIMGVERIRCEIFQRLQKTHCFFQRLLTLE